MNLSASQASLEQLMCGISAPGGASATDVQRHLDSLTKPPGSLGGLERLAARLARISGDPPPVMARRVICIMAADHGVAAEGVSAYPQAVTAQMCRNYANRGAAVNAIAHAVLAEVAVVDVGVNCDLRDVPELIHRKVRSGTGNLARGPALTRSEVHEALDVGRQVFENDLRVPDVVGLGEMGIGNTTAASAVTAALLGVPAERVVGPGTGVDPAVIDRKIRIVRSALGRCASADPIEVLCQVGGLEIAALAGLTLTAARHGRPIIVDGFITGAAALVAHELSPHIDEYLFASHLSAEPGHRVQLDHLGLEPVLQLDMRLGEGTGAALMLPFLDAAGSVLRNMATFESAGVSRRADEGSAS